MVHRFRSFIHTHRLSLVGVTFALLAAVGFSAKAILVKLAYAANDIDAPTLLALRMAFSVPFFLIAAVYAARKGDAAPLTRQDLIAVIVLGFIGYYLSSYLDFAGLAYITAGLERLILFLYPTMTVVLSAILFKRGITRRETLALTLSYAGIALVFMHDVATPGDHLLIGAGLVFASTLTYSAYLIGAGRVIARLGSLRFTAYAMLVASLACFIQVLARHPASVLFAQSTEVYQYSFAMAIFSTVLPVFMLSAAIQRIGAAHAALIGSIGPVSTIFMAQHYLGETVTLLQIAGSGLVLSGVLAISLSKRKVGAA
ncbi:MAG: DMT family transporter [Pseudomonadota bacterium]